MQDTIQILWPIVVAHLAVLVIIIVVIKRLLLGDTVRAVDRIGQAEAEIRKKEETMKQEMERHEQELAARRGGLEREFESRREETERASAQVKEQVLEQARREAADILDKARKNERKLRDQLALELEDKAVDFGGRVFRMVFSGRITEEIDRHFVDELLDALAETDATGMTVSASDAEFRASHPLSAEQKQRLQTILSEKFGVNVEVQESLQDDLLAGLVMKLGSLEIDGSLRSRYQEAVAELKKEAV
jgi:F0F1-type ATP synthase membrane subunit b/b'